MLFDGHLDLAMNALGYERDLLLSVDALRARERDPEPTDGRNTCTTSLHEMRAAGVGVAVTTLLARAKPWVAPGRVTRRAMGDWPTQGMAHAQARGQLAYYEWLEKQGHVRVLRTAADLTGHAAAWKAAPKEAKPPLGLIVTFECADPVTDPEELAWWHNLGVRTLMLTHFGQGHYAAGNPSDESGNEHDVDGPVTPRGRVLLAEMQRLGMPLDLTHLSDTSVRDALEHFGGRVYSSHSNCRAIAPRQRQLTDAVVRSIAERDGVLGVVTYFGFIQRGGFKACYPAGGGVPTHQATLDHLADHIDHICQVTGDRKHVALGSDLDGGYGAEECPQGLNRHRDVLKLGALLRNRGFGDDEVQAFFGGNWLRFFGETLPGGGSS
ncbi:MAG: membrane dipeptidase [Algisphaera sp.]